MACKAANNSQRSSSTLSGSPIYTRFRFSRPTPSQKTASTAFCTTRRVSDRTAAKKRRLCAKHAAPGCAHVHADFHGEYGRLIQVVIHGNTRGIPHTLRVAAAAQAVDGWKRPTHPTKAQWLGMDCCSTGLHWRRPTSGYNRADPALIPALTGALRLDFHHLQRQFRTIVLRVRLSPKSRDCGIDVGSDTVPGLRLKGSSSGN
jgi:hypothetical protein